MLVSVVVAIVVAIVVVVFWLLFCLFFVVVLLLFCSCLCFDVVMLLSELEARKTEKKGEAKNGNNFLSKFKGGSYVCNLQNYTVFAFVVFWVFLGVLALKTRYKWGFQPILGDCLFLGILGPEK